MNKLREYTVPVSEANPGESPIFRHPDAKNGFVTPTDPRRINMQQQLLGSFEKHAQRKSLGVFNEERQEYDYLTYQVFIQNIPKEVKEQSTALGSALLSLNTIIDVIDYRNVTIKPVGIYLRNRREWTQIDIACQLYGLTSCPFYDTLGTESIRYTIMHTGVSVCFCQANTAKTLASADIPDCLKYIIAVETIDPQSLEIFKQKNIQIIDYTTFMQSGQKDIKPYPKLEKDQPLTLVFTSGTTGQPKAAVQTHANIVSMLSLFSNDQNIRIFPEDVYLSYLPLPHTFERVVHLAALSEGAEVNFYSGNVQQLGLDIQRCKPTYFCSVPRLYNRFYEGIQTTISQLPADQKAQFDKALKMKLDLLRQTGKTTHEQLDAAFVKTKAILGGRQRILITGAAPISAEVLEFLKVAFCVPIIEGYGQTETCAASFLTDYYDTKCGHVGGPTISQEYKLVDVPEMGYKNSDVIDGIKTPRGEVCLRGPSVISGYFKNQQQTEETFEKDGFCHTGDIGMILPNGALKLIDRKKNLFKLAQGEYVSPELIENTYVRAKGVSECLIFGDSLKNYCVAIVVAEPTYLKKLASELKIEGSHEELCQNIQIRQIILNNCIEEGKSAKLNGFEQIKNLFLESKIFAQVGILTETQKMQRHVAKIHYKDVLQGLYEELKD